MPAQLETYLEQAPAISQKVMNVAGSFASQGSYHILTEEFKSLADKASRFEQARRLAANHREFNLLTVDEQTAERETRMAFAKLCQALDVSVDT